MAATHSPRFLQLCEKARSQVTEITVAELRARQEQPGAKLHLYDVREDHEWQQGHLPDATHLGKGIIERDIERQIPDPDTEIILYCGGGYRSALAAQALKEMGYTRVLSLAGGFRGWREAGLPLQGEPAAAR